MVPAILNEYIERDVYSNNNNDDNGDKIVIEAEEEGEEDDIIIEHHQQQEQDEIKFEGGKVFEVVPEEYKNIFIVDA